MIPLLSNQLPPLPSIAERTALGTKGDDASGLVSYASFEEKMLEIMASRAWDPDPPEILLKVKLDT